MIYDHAIVTSYFASCGLPEPVFEYKFCPDRKFRFDLAWPVYSLALEVQGGLFARTAGGHNRGAGIRKEHEKRNLAASAGWLILYVLPAELCMQETVDLIHKAMHSQRGDS